LVANEARTLCCLKYKASFLVATQIINLSKKNTHAQIQLKQKLVLQLKVNHELNSTFVSLQKSDLGWCNPAYPTLGTYLVLRGSRDRTPRLLGQTTRFLK
jgi:hypothetical protein